MGNCCKLKKLFSVSEIKSHIEWGLDTAAFRGEPLSISGETYFNIKYDINEERQKMVDGWPSEVDCSNALQDWNWKPKYNLDDSFREYFIPFLKSKEVSS